MSDQSAQAATGQPSQPQAGGISSDTLTPVADETSQADASTQVTTTLTLDQALRELTKARQEAASYRVAHRDAAAKVSEYERAAMTEQERQAAQLADSERARSELALRHQEAVVQYETKLAAHDLGIIDPDVAAKLLDSTRIEYDDAGAPKNLGKLLRELVAAKPYLVTHAGTTPAQPSVSPTNPASASNSATFTDQQIAAMTPDEWKKNKAAVMAAMREGRIRQG